MSPTALLSWTPVCHLDRLEPDRGVAALVGGVQIALFHTPDGLFAVDNRDPVSGAYVMSRGIVGSRGGVPTVASPLHKQVYDLRTGRCLDLPGTALPCHPVRCRDGLVEVRPRTPDDGPARTDPGPTPGPGATALPGLAPAAGHEALARVGAAPPTRLTGRGDA